MSRLTHAIRNALLVAASLPMVGSALSAASVQLSAWDRVVMEGVFSKADANDDGQLSRDEAARLGVFGERFDALDSNRDGALDLEEFAVGFVVAT